MATVRIPQSSLFNNSLMLFVSFLLVTIPLINGFSVLVSKTHPSTVFLADCKNRGNASYRARWTTKTTTLLAKDDTESSSGEKSYFATAVVTELSNDSPNTVEGSSKALQVVTVDDDDDDDDANPYLKIGIEPEQLALGVKANEFLKYIGTREQLVQKTMEDVDSFDRVKAEEEVAKFMLDAEMVNLYIQYGKEVERDPTFVVPDTEKDEDGIFSFRTVVILYLGYVAYDSFPRIFRNWVYDQQLQGTWKGTNIQLIDEWIQKTEPAISAARAAAAAAAADATATISAVGDTLQQQQTIADSFIQNSALPDAMIQLSMESLVTTVQTATQTLMMT